MRWTIFMVVAGIAALSISGLSARAQPLEGHPTAAQMDARLQAVTACESYAGEGSSLEQVIPALALPACSNALRQYPNSPRLLFALGRAYYKSGDLYSAARLYRQAADQGVGGAEIGLAYLYLNGQGVPKDYAQALVWYRKAADQGWSGAQYGVGLIYANGWSVPQDYAQAAAWYSKAAAQGFSDAQNNLGSLYERGLGVERDYQKALELYRKAAEQGNKQAQNNFASLKPRAQVSDKLSKAQQQGYRQISFEDFKLDGKQLAEGNAKLILSGAYSKSGDLEILQPSGLAVATARRYGNDSGIPVLSDDAARNVRKYFLECGNNPLAQLGCPVTVSGHADLCTLTNLLGSKSVPCLVVEDGW